MTLRIRGWLIRASISYAFIDILLPLPVQNGKNLLICLALTLVPTVLFFLAGLLQRRHRQAAWGSLLASLFFLLAAAGWLYTLCDSWNLWSAARAASLLTAGQLRALQAAAITGAVSGLLPLLSQIPAALHRK